MERRAALAATAGGLAWPLLRRIACAGGEGPLLLSARGTHAEAEGGFRASRLDGALVAELETPAGRHFFGHDAFSRTITGPAIEASGWDNHLVAASA